MDLISLALGIVGVLLAFATLPAVAQRFERRRDARRVERWSSIDPPPASMSTVEATCRDRLYYHIDGWVSALRLFGADDELIPATGLQVAYDATPFKIPPELRKTRDDVVQQKLSAASSTGQIYFDGPNTRLLRWRISPKDDTQVAREANTLEVHLGPVSWYDFEGLNGAFRAQPDAARPEQLYEYYVGLASLLQNGDVAASRLSNILDNAVSLVTCDGFVGYQERSHLVSLGGGLLTSSVAENTNRFLDDASPNDPLFLYNRDNELSDAPTDYQPKGVPHPLAAVIRGIGSELSPELAANLNLANLYITGISFDLHGLHPSLLFAVFLDLSHPEVLDIARKYPGIEHVEGSLKFIPASLDSGETRSVLRSADWIPSGQASVIRALEVTRGLARRHRTSGTEAIRYLCAGGSTR